MTPELLFLPGIVEQALEAHRVGDLARAKALYTQVLDANPRQPAALHLLGVLLQQTGEAVRGLALIRQAISLEPTTATFHDNLGVALCQHGEVDAAIAAHREALRWHPDWGTAYSHLGVALHQAGRFDEAVSAFRAAISVDETREVEARTAMGIVFRDQHRLDEAIAEFRAALRIAPEIGEIHNNLANALSSSGRVDEAIASLRTALRLQPGSATAELNLSNLMRLRGDVDKAIEGYRRAVALCPEDHRFRSNLVYAMLFAPTAGAVEIAEELRTWNTIFAEPLRPANLTHPNSKEPARRLRIGYVSPDFRDHVVGRNMLPVLTNHDPEQFETFCYSSVRFPDELTREFQDCADEWRETGGMTDQRLTQEIRKDGIDILVDLTLHMSDNRLQVFARKPAPVQVSFAGYPASTGLTAIDYRLSDPFLDPQGEKSFGPEEVIRLPHSFWCYDPMGINVEPNKLPAAKSGHITFGCFNTLAKVNSRTLEIWAAVLNSVRGSRLRLLAPDGGHRQLMVETLRAHGVKPAQIDFLKPRPRADYLKLYHQVDIALDTFPYNGHTTSLDALWMGVPMVTMEGDLPVSRGGVSMLQNLGLPEWIARDKEDFVRIATDLANDRARLSELRSTLRGRMEASPLMDKVGFTRGIESAYRTMWERWCAPAASHANS